VDCGSEWDLELPHIPELKVQPKPKQQDRGEPSRHHQQTQNNYAYLFNRSHTLAVAALVSSGE
jgi:hypothetical protein